MHMDEELLRVMNQIRQDETAIAQQENFEKEIIESVQNGMVTLEDRMIEFEERSLFGEKVKLRIPKAFGIMDPELAALKYPSEKRPDPIFSNENGTITISFNHTGSTVTNEEIPDFKKFMRQSLKKMQSSVEFLTEGVNQVHEKPVGYFDFLSPALDVTIYNLIFFAPLEGRALLVSFNCTENELRDWKPIAKGMMASLRITEA